ncbi:hypothetical protein BDR26DRAFT_852170 [Obelidium mucronatum]|nr:hypothetical protein BDR26DRAFT_852170 [Obelidium mucronatum]
MGSLFSKVKKRVDPRPPKNEESSQSLSKHAPSSDQQRNQLFSLQDSAKKHVDTNPNILLPSNPDSSHCVETRSVISINPSIASWSHYQKKEGVVKGVVGNGQEQQNCSKSRMHNPTTEEKQNSCYPSSENGNRTIQSTKAAYRKRFRYDEDDDGGGENFSEYEDDEGSLVFDDVLLSPTARSLKHGQDGEESVGAKGGRCDPDMIIDENGWKLDAVAVAADR